MPISVVKTIKTPWAPYAATFSRDGTRLAFGGGSWYGHGGIELLALNDGRTGVLQWTKVQWIDQRRIHSVTSWPTSVPSISGLCFSDDDRVLAASMWSSSHHYAPTMLFAVEGIELSPVQVFDNDAMDPFIEAHGPVWSFRGTPTGVLLHEGYVITRQHNTAPDGTQVIILNPIPTSIDIPASGHMQHLTHSRLIVVHDTVITEAGGSRGVWRLQADGTHAPAPATEGLALRSLRQPKAPPAVVPAADCPRVTAIATLPGEQGFVTGGNQGQIDSWSWDGAWRQRRIRAAVDHPRSAGRLGEPESIQAIVTRAGTHDLAAVSWAGDLLLRRAGDEWECHQLTERGSPRSLAAHPTKPWLAVGIKQGGFDKPQSVITILEIEP